MSVEDEDHPQVERRASAGKPSAKETLADAQPAPLVVGIGASAGGLDAFRTFFSRMPADSGMAFILVQHMDPAHASALPEILRKSTTMDVVQAQDGDAITPDRVLVIPPDAILKVASGKVSLTRPASPTARRSSINTFLASLAEDQRENAVGVILSGFGADGATGVEAIKEFGGLTLSQAEFDHAPKAGMPQSAAASGYVDHVLAVEDMPAALLKHARYRTKTDKAKGPDGLRADLRDHIGVICAVLNSRLGRDFSHYKPSSLMRRVQRRMQVLQIADVPGYVEQLRARPDEAELLFRELLIRVTQFFRDREAFAAVAKALPDLLRHGNIKDPVRIWVPGCATGEEAYSLAILVREAMARSDRLRRVLIFATDIDDQAIEVARAGVYPETIVADLGQDLVERYFTKEGDRLRVGKDIRQMCLFSIHDLVKDPPFSKLDMISCRNVLIYFGPALQKRVVTMFHYGLRPSGLLFLGASEAVTSYAPLFAPLDKKHRLFKRKAGPGQVLRSQTAASSPGRVATPRTEREMDPRVAQVMGRYTPAHAVIDGRYNVLQLSGPIVKFLEPTIEAVGLKLPDLVLPSLRTALRTALKRAAATGRRIIEEGQTIDTANGRETLNLVVEPLPGEDGAGEDLFVVAFQDLGALHPGPPPEPPSASVQMEHLVVARERLQTLTEELETTNEELQSSNEEYQSVNEELQSLNEELETSREELQSMNEELGTVNAELNLRNESLADVNSDLKNLIDSTAIATLFLDQDMRIKRFTPAVLDLFSVRAGDEGRPITDIVSHLAPDGMHEDARTVFRTLVPVEREVSMANGDRTFQMAMRPYRDVGNAISGVVVTFVDVTDRRRAEVDRARLAAIVDSSIDAIISHDLDGRVTSWNTGAERLYGYTRQDAIGMPMESLLSDAQAEEWPALLARLVAGDPVQHFDSTRTAKSGRSVAVSMTLSPIRDANNAVVGVSAVARDITDRKWVERQTAMLLDELDHRVKNILAVVSSVVTQTLQTSPTPAEFAEAVESRIKAIASAHSVLSREGGKGVRLSDIIKTEVAPYDGPKGRVSIDGTNVIVTPKAGFALAMAIHELTTNAVKYGALSNASGRVAVTWTETRGSHPMLDLRWTESGGPPVLPPSKRGFGTTLIERTLTYEFDATVERRFEPAGLTCTFTVPMNEELGFTLAPASDSGGA